MKLKQYSPIVRKFCLSLHYYSPRAYQFVRETFKNNLPHPKTIQNWYSMSDLSGEPGIQKQHLERLKKIVVYIRFQKKWAHNTNIYYLKRSTKSFFKFRCFRLVTFLCRKNLRRAMNKLCLTSIRMYSASMLVFTPPTMKMQCVTPWKNFIRIPDLYRAIFTFARL